MPPGALWPHYLWTQSLQELIPFLTIQQNTLTAHRNPSDVWANPRITWSGKISPTFSKIKQVPGKKNHWWDRDTCYWGGKCPCGKICKPLHLPFKCKQGWVMPTTVLQLLKPLYFKYPRGKLLCTNSLHCIFLPLSLFANFSPETFLKALGLGLHRDEFPEAGVPPC